MKVQNCLWGLVLLLMLCGCVSSTDKVPTAKTPTEKSPTEKCKLTPETKSERKILDLLAPLLNKNFTVQKQEGEDSYTYVFQLCGDANGVAGAGVVQINDKTKEETVVGLYNSTKAIGGTYWVMLIYENGQKYGSHCQGANRKAIIMVSCDKSINVGPLQVVLEDREGNDCFYLFEMSDSAVCPVVQSQLSAGSILLIVVVCLVGVYLIVGFLYQRLVVGAKGMDQIPHYPFWAEFGNLAADGCDLVCRSKNREEPNMYRGVASEPAEEEPEERDDHLLPM